MSGLSADVGNRLNDVKNTFSSWDTCMSKAYCKWPVIVGIVVASIIVFTIVWSCVACLCCGVSFCAGCMRCFTCFGCCGACKSRGGGGGGGGGSRHKDDYTKMTPSPYNGYQPQPSPMSYQPPSGPQYAQFDASSQKIHADSLPAMPTWGTSRTARVEDHSETANGFGNDVEMGRMNTMQPQTRNRGAYNQVPTGPMSPMSPPLPGYGRMQGPSDPYSSDLGAQRLGTQQVLSADFHPTPLSPAPTYRTLPSLAGAATTDRFARGTMSPAPSEYNDHTHTTFNRDPVWSPIHETQHEPVDYHYHPSSPSPVEQQSLSYFHPPQEQSGVRPPSLLQIGRKPVAGSHREI